MQSRARQVNALTLTNADTTTRSTCWLLLSAASKWIYLFVDAFEMRKLRKWVSSLSAHTCNCMRDSWRFPPFTGIVLAHLTRCRAVVRIKLFGTLRILQIVCADRRGSLSGCMFWKCHNQNWASLVKACDFKCICLPLPLSMCVVLHWHPTHTVQKRRTSLY